eukprot:gnl/TRDRNA2_/TRDRNA2_32871_c0_seq1.p1 gnl/TRDRNA2_/TRDRNA2_32871_c0~~gnl/TRDRNA2_/TRDRNA2_32871_c0_seq1.p1  ORF type:complete len:236 (-),score=22.90 gnl/TRDRNA2_/TRDRNA2_32871_c0_seq1:493-1200(-)
MGIIFAKALSTLPHYASLDGTMHRKSPFLPPKHPNYSAPHMELSASASTERMRGNKFRRQGVKHGGQEARRLGIQHVSYPDKESALMGPIVSRPPLQPTASGTDAQMVLRKDGVVRLDNILSPHTALSARTAVIERLQAVLEQGNRQDRTKLGEVLCRTSRYDLLLHLDSGPVEAALREALSGRLGDLMEALVGLEAPLYELAACRLCSSRATGRTGRSSAKCCAEPHDTIYYCI